MRLAKSQQTPIRGEPTARDREIPVGQDPSSANMPSGAPTPQGTHFSSPRLFGKATRLFLLSRATR